MSRLASILLPLSLLILLAVPGRAAETEEALYAAASRLIESYSGQRENLTRAAEFTSRLLEKNPRSAPGLLNAARLTLLGGYINYTNFEQNKVFRAQQLVNQALEIDPDFADAHILGAYAFIADKTAKGLRAARRMAARGEELAPGSPRVELLYARIAKDEEDWDEVLRRANRVLANADDADLVRMGYGYLVDVYRHRKEYDKAEAAYRTILELAPDAPWPRVNFASFLYHRGRYDEAIEYGEAALAIMDFGMGHHVLGRAYYKKAARLQWEEKRYEESKPYFAKAILHKPDYAHAYYGLGMACYRTGHRDRNVADLQKAEQALEQALRIDPEHEQAREQLGSLRKLLEWVEKNK